MELISEEIKEAKKVIVEEEILENAEEKKDPPQVDPDTEVKNQPSNDQELDEIVNNDAIHPKDSADRIEK